MDAIGAGADCRAAIWTAKGEMCAPLAAEMRESGLRYIAFVGVFCCNGRVRPPEFAVTIGIAEHAARQLDAHKASTTVASAVAAVAVASVTGFARPCCREGERKSSLG